MSTTSGQPLGPVPQHLLTASDFIGVRAELIAWLGNDPLKAVVLTRISFRADGRWREAHEAEGIWWWRATYETIAEETGLTRDQVKRAITSLTQLGVLESRKFSLEGRYDQTASYALAGSPDDRADSPDEDRADSPDVPLSQKREDTPLTPSKAKSASKAQSYHGGEKLTDEEIDAEFEVWYKGFPRRVGRGSARKAFATARRQAPLDALVDGAARYAAQVRREQIEPRYIKHPSSWLNGEHWADELGAAPGTGRDAVREIPTGGTPVGGWALPNLPGGDPAPAAPRRPADGIREL